MRVPRGCGAKRLSPGLGPGATTPTVTARKRPLPQLPLPLLLSSPCRERFTPS